jgi:tungstate transport system permease protein
VGRYGYSTILHRAFCVGYVLTCIGGVAAIDTLREAGLQALELMTGLDQALIAIVVLSLQVSLGAVLLSCLIALPVGAATAVGRFPGRQLLIVALNAFMGLPPVVVGLIVYLALSRAGPLGSMGLLFTPTAMVLAQALLVTPIIAALTRQIVADAWDEYREQLQSLGSSGFRSALTLVWDTRFSLSTAVLAGLGRAMAEVGAVMIVGGNIDGVTRVMTTAIALETSKGDLALALALGVVLIVLVVLLNSTAYVISEIARRRYG